MTKVRVKVRAIILAITGLVVAVLVIRLGLDLFSASSSNSVIKFFFDLSDPLVKQFDGVIVQSRTSAFRNVNVAAIIGILVYSILGILISEIVTSFLYESYENIVQNLVDIFFKIIEFLVFSRIVIDFFLIQDKAPFIQRINDLTNWTQDAVVAVNFLEGRVNLSAILILIIIVIFDIVTESLIKSLFSTVGPEDHMLKHAYDPQPQQPAQPQPNIFVGNQNPNPQPQQPIVQNINITVPNQYQNPQQPVPQPVNVINPQSNHVHPTHQQHIGQYQAPTPAPQTQQTQYPPTHYNRSQSPLVQEATFRNPNSNFVPRQPINQPEEKKKGMFQKVKGFFNPEAPR